MDPEFSDPAWWPRRFEEPKTTSATRLILGTLIPAVVGIVIVAVILTQKHHSAGAQQAGSVLAFETCIVANGVKPTTRNGSTRQQTAIDNCRTMLPQGTHISNFGSAGTAQDQFSECMSDAGSGRSQGGRFGSRRPSESYLNAFEICRTLTQAGDPGQAPPTTAPTSTAPPIA
jgi:hypothetical protein